MLFTLVQWTWNCQEARTLSCVRAVYGTSLLHEALNKLQLGKNKLSKKDSRQINKPQNFRLEN